MPGYTTYRTTAPALVRLARTNGTANAGFLALILSAGFAFNHLAGILMNVSKNLAK